MRPTALQRKYWIAVTGLCFFTLILAFVKIAPEDGGDATGKIILSLFFAPVVFIALFVNLHSVSYNEEKLAYCNFLLKKKELYFKDIIDHHTHSLGYKLQLRTNESSYFLSNKLDGFVEFIRFLIDENYIRCSKYEFLELAAISGK